MIWICVSPATRNYPLAYFCYIDGPPKKYTYLQNKRMRRCGMPPPPPPQPIIFERLKLPQQIIYRRKENLSESPNHQKYWENILVSRFYEQFSRNRRNLGHFRKFEKIWKSLKFFRTSKNGLNSAYFAKIAHKIAKPKYFPNISDDSDSPIDSLSDDI